MRAADAVTFGLVSAVAPAVGRVVDVAENESIELTPSFARTALGVERAESMSAEIIVTATSNAAAPMHVVRRCVRRVGGGISRTVTRRFLVLGLVTNSVPSRHPRHVSIVLLWAAPSPPRDTHEGGTVP